MTDTGFAVPSRALDRFGPSYSTKPGGDTREVYDPTDGQWSRPPAFPSGGDGLVSTVADFHAFAEMLRAGGSYQGERLLSRATVTAMTTNQLTADQILASDPDFSGAMGWGFGVGVQLRRLGPALSIGSFRWDGGLGTSWANDPAEDLIGILLTNQMFTSAGLPPVCQDFWTCVYAAITD